MGLVAGCWLLVGGGDQRPGLRGPPWAARTHCDHGRAKAPIVPIVFRNTLDVLPKHGLVLRPATVEVVVHKPIPTATWKRKDLDRHIGEIYRLFEKTLAA